MRRVTLSIAVMHGHHTPNAANGTKGRRATTPLGEAANVRVERWFACLRGLQLALILSLLKFNQTVNFNDTWKHTYALVIIYVHAYNI